MLTSTPIAPRSTSASPRTFHYAPTLTSPQLSPKVTANLPRRHSKHSVAAAATATPKLSAQGPSQSPHHGRASKQYVGVDAATQYSPMEPFNPAVPVQNARPTAAAPVRPTSTASTTATTTLTETASVPPSRAVSVADAHKPTPRKLSSANSAAASTLSLSPRRIDGVNGTATNPMSPAKRRNSQDLAQASTSSQVASSQSSSPKRSKTAQGPAKVLPLQYELCDVEDMVVLIANMLSELIETNDSLAMKSGHLTRFHSRTAPGISVVDYLHRLAKHATLTPPLLLSMVYYIDRLCALYPDFTINTLTVHRFLITAATVAGKGLSDAFWNNSFYARVGGVKVAELKLLELEFLYRVDWKIVPNPEVLVAYYKGLVDRCSGYILQEEELSSDSVDEGGSSEGLYD